MTSEPRLSEIASHLIQPSGIVSSDFGKVNRIATACGISFDTWQKGVLYLLLSKKENGRYACGEGGLVLSSCRQIGKTFTLGTTAFILCIDRKSVV